MKLYYHKGKNFGDQLNPLIFDHFLPGYFDNNDETLFVGIGSLIGLTSRFPVQKIVFSSGLAAGDDATYGPVPQDLSSYDFVCVRGPKTAERLGLDRTLAITDGAILLGAMPLNLTRTKEVISLMPHAGSEKFCDHQKIADALGWQLISPCDEPVIVMQKMMRSKFIVTEAMHGAIVADTLRVPWIPYQGYKTINDFKWNDWCQSMELEYDPFYLKPYFANSFLMQLLENKIGASVLRKLPLVKGLLRVILSRQMKWRFKKNIESLKKNGVWDRVQLSNQVVFDDRMNKMLEKIKEVKEKFKFYGTAN